MWFPGRIRHVAAIDIQPALKALEQLDESVWFADDETKRFLAGNRPTQSLFFYSMTKEEYITTLRQRPLQQSDVKTFQAYDLLYSDFAYLFDFVQQHYPAGGVFLRAQIARMPPGGTIGEHRDSMMILENTHRLHIPIVTTSKLKFVVDNEPVSLKAGELYELNNQLNHWVKNPANSINRIHLIFDYLPPEYNVPASTDENFKFFIREHRVARPAKPSNLSVEKPEALALVAGSIGAASGGYTLHEVDLDKGTAEKVFDCSTIDSSAFAKGGDIELAGVAAGKGVVAIACGDSVHILSSDYNYRCSASSELLIDACSLSVEGNYLFVASRGTDSVLRYDIKRNCFDTIWRFYVAESRKIAAKKDAIDSTSVAEPSCKFAIDSVKVANGTLYVSGGNLSHMLIVGNNAVDAGQQLPQRTTSAVSFNKGLAFCNPDMKRVAYLADSDYRVVNSDALPEIGGVNPNFSRGLSRHQKGTLMVGLQPAGVALLDMKNQAVVTAVKIEAGEASSVLDLDLIK